MCECRSEEKKLQAEATYNLRRQCQALLPVHVQADNEEGEEGMKKNGHNDGAMDSTFDETQNERPAGMERQQRTAYQGGQI